MSRLRSRNVAPLLALALTACGGGSAPEGEPPAPAGGTPDAAVRDADAPDGGPGRLEFPCVGAECAAIVERPPILARPRCPDSAPSAGQPCADYGLDCSYGSSPAAECREYFTCDGTWAPVRRSRRTCDETVACPDVRPEHGDTCPVTLPVDARVLPCFYGALWCRCIPVAPDWSRWGCLGPPRDERCPLTLPHLGEGCASPGVHCMYDFDFEYCREDDASSVFCYGGEWQVGPGWMCPF
ncbi:MAG: hypothetical protein FJ104_02735 [Deltaproteobacteria bacterium]|nr:hypothetical protein [Deltaproteobacteria bacterium]